MHKLTEILYGKNDFHDLEDKAIRNFLSDAASKIQMSKFCIGETRQRDIEFLLGFESEPKSPMWCDCHGKKLHECPNNQEFIKSMTEPKDSKTWCSHCVWIETYNFWQFKATDQICLIGHTWNQCPICGTPRPKKVEEKSLATKFLDWLDNSIVPLIKGESVKEASARQLANIATEHFTQNPKNHL